MNENNMDNTLEEIYTLQHQVVEVKKLYSDERFYIEMPVQYMIPKKKDGC